MFPTLICTSKRGVLHENGDSTTNREVFYPKVIVLDREKVDLACTIPSDEIEEKKITSFASLFFNKTSREWCIRGLSNIVPLYLNDLLLDGQVKLQNNDIVRFGKHDSRNVKYKFHYNTGNEPPKEICTSSTIVFDGFLPQLSRKRPRSRSNNNSEDTSVLARRERLNTLFQGLAHAVSSHSHVVHSKEDKETIISKSQEHINPEAESTRTGSKNTALSALISELTCTICTELFYKTITLECGHSFCKECIDQWLAHSLTCPICRAAVSKPPVNSLVSDKSISIILANDQKRREAFLKRKGDSETRMKESEECRDKLDRVLFHALKAGYHFVSILNKWSKRERMRFLKGVKAYRGPARESYCKSVSLTPTFIREASNEQLLNAIMNLGLKPCNSKVETSTQTESDSYEDLWREKTTDQLRNRLLMFIYWS